MVYRYIKFDLFKLVDVFYRILGTYNPTRDFIIFKYFNIECNNERCIEEIYYGHVGCFDCFSNRYNNFFMNDTTIVEVSWVVTITVSLNFRVCQVKNVMFCQKVYECRSNYFKAI